MADYRVRSQITNCLRARACDSGDKPFCEAVSRKAAFQLALCYKMGFGIMRDEKESQFWLKFSSRGPKGLDSGISLVEREVQFRRSTFQRLWHQGHMKAMDFAQHYREQRQLHQVDSEYRREIADVEKVLGELHPVILTLKSILISVMLKERFLEEAEKLSVQVMERSFRAFGEEHPYSLTSMGNLASTYAHQGRWKEAQLLEMRILEIKQRIFGVEHPSTLTSMLNLAFTYRNKGQWKEAEALEVQVMETRKHFAWQWTPRLLDKDLHPSRKVERGREAGSTGCGDEKEGTRRRTSLHTDKHH
jgi:hypothetical protein